MNLIEMLLLILVVLAAVAVCGTGALIACRMREETKRAKGFYHDERE